MLCNNFGNYSSHQQNNRQKCCPSTSNLSSPKKQISMASLISWNVSKAVELNPNIDLKDAMKTAHGRLELESREASIMSQSPEEQHVTCAVLAWQQLGHSSVDSLHDFIENQKKSRPAVEDPPNEEEDIVEKPELPPRLRGYINYIPSKYSMRQDNSFLAGPVLKLPVETKVVMRVEQPEHKEHKSNPLPAETKKEDIKSKIDTICCMDRVCVQMLADIKSNIDKLRVRAAQLAQREAERVELLERAETAWRDLELSYQRRLCRSEEKEDTLTKQMEHVLQERNGNKKVVTQLAQTVSERGSAAKKAQDQLAVIEKAVCDRASLRSQLSEKAAKGDAALVQQQCRFSQVDRDLQLKEEQARRKLVGIEKEIDAVRELRYESERVLRNDLNNLKEQIANVSKQLLDKVAENDVISNEIVNLRQEKQNLIDDLDGCVLICDKNAEGRVEVLKKKREQLKEFKEKVIECQCKLPQDASVEVKRTPSLAALCYCAPEDKYLESCSCTSLRSQLLSNLLSDLFSGLQSELGSGAVTLMPCQLLKCLDDKHNWDKASTVKTNLSSFFSKLLVGELDIAIATSIEKYHARWAGRSCADAIKRSDSENDGWQERAIEQRAQKLATELAEQLFNEKAEELTKKAKKIVAEGPPPCECKPTRGDAAAYTCLVKASGIPAARKTNDTYLKKTMQDVNEIRQQIEDLKKESIKKVDLKLMENKITKIFQRASKNERKNKSIEDAPLESYNIAKPEKDIEINNNIKTNTSIFKRNPDYNILKKNNKLTCRNKNGRIEKPSTIYKKLEQCFAVNVCLCGAQDNSRILEINNNSKEIKELKSISNTRKHVPNSRRSKSINMSKEVCSSCISKRSAQLPCPSQCICFHKVPSNTSINKLLETLTNWNGDINEIIEDYKQGDKINTLDVIENLNPSTEHNKYIPCLQSATINEIEKNKTKTCSARKFAQSDEPSNPIMTNKEFSYIATLPNSSYMTDSLNYKQKCNIDMENNPTFATTTESEYMGAINLDKSNEEFCKCIINPKNEKKYADVDCQSETPFKCTNPDFCFCEKSQSKLDKAKSNFKKNNSVFKTDFQVNSFISQEQRLTDTETTNSTPITKDETEADIRGDSFICDIVNKSELFPNNQDYYVKFLGVTLCNNVDQETNNNCQSVSQKNHKNTDSIEGVMGETSSSKIKKTKNSSSLKCNLSNCKFTKISAINLGHDFSPKCKNVCESKVSIYDQEKDDEKCVCCKYTENTKELEVNAFNLLKEHLKEKFSEFKQTSNFTGIPTEEENKLFMSVLDKIKAVISENTSKKTPCRCLIKQEHQGTWSRAYGLLQEYLKIKVKKVQCSCIKISNKSNTILHSSILDKITDLIEKDFERLKDKYKLDNLNPNFKSLDIQTTNSLLGNIKQYLNEMALMRDTGTSKSTNEISAQVPYYFSLENKSCDAMNSVKTLEKVTSCKLGNQMYVTNCGCQNTNTAKSYLHKNIIVNQCSQLVPDTQVSKLSLNNSNENFERNFNLNEKFSKHKTELHKESKPSLPYIGYTLNCSCDRNLGTCICSKSAVQTNTDKIKCIWKSVTHYNIPKKMSYIMREPGKVKSEVITCTDPNDICLLNMSQARSSQPVKFSSTCTNTLNLEQGLLLKYSQNKLNNHYNDSYTLDETSLMNNDSDHYHQPRWYDCSTIPHTLTDSANRTLDRNILYDSLFLPTQKLNASHECDLLNCKENSSLKLSRCTCKSVPICHVKLLVEDIEKKLIYSKCICDSLSSRACPLHSKKGFC